MVYLPWVVCVVRVFFFVHVLSKKKIFKFDLVDQLNCTLFKTMTSVRCHFTRTAATYKAVVFVVVDLK